MTALVLVPLCLTMGFGGALFGWGWCSLRMTVKAQRLEGRAHDLDALSTALAMRQAELADQHVERDADTGMPIRTAPSGVLGQPGGQSDWHGVHASGVSAVDMIARLKAERGERRPTGRATVPGDRHDLEPDGPNVLHVVPEPGPLTIEIRRIAADGYIDFEHYLRQENAHVG